MSRKLVLTTIFISVLIGMLGLSIKIQRVEASGTIYIRADGSVEPEGTPISTSNNVTYTLTGNVTRDGDGIVVEKDSIVFDGAGYTVQGTGASDSKGISHSGRSNVTIKNTKIRNFYHGLWLTRAPDYAESSHYNSISGNTITNNSYDGIHLYGSSNNSISGNEITNNFIGIYLEEYSNFNSVSGNNLTNNESGLENGWDSSDNSISGNNIVDNHDAGIRFYGRSSNNVVSGNLFANDGLFMDLYYGNFVNFVVEDNFVNGKPLVYLEGVSHQSVGEAGQVILLNCEQVQVKNLNLSQTTIGIELWNTNNTMVSGNTITANRRYGVYLSGSSNNNTITGNKITNTTTTNRGYGILLDSTSNNTISGNYITNNDYGIELWYSKYNTISGNNITANRWNGIELYPASTNNNVTGNNITNNGYDVWNGYGVVDSSSNNTISGNNINGNGKTAQGGGIWFYSSSNETVSGNNITNNYYGIYLYGSSNNSVYHNNFIDNTRQVYSSDSAYANVWDDSYPSGGNYWSDYNGADADHDGIGDTPYIIDANNTDHYPLMNIIPEFPSFFVLSLFMITTLLSIVVYRKKHAKISRTP